MQLTKEELLGLYKTMVRIRTFELKVAELVATGRLPGFAHLYAGQKPSLRVWLTWPIRTL
jgi:pyruvate dehydrogenase E1 component alpha subunit